MVEGSQRRIFQIWPFSTLPNWSSMMFIESHFLRYPTCLIFAQVVLVVEKSAVGSLLPFRLAPLIWRFYERLLTGSDLKQGHLAAHKFEL